MVFHNLRNFSERISTCHICGTFIESGPCISQEESSLFQLYICLRRGGIMNNGAMFTVGADRLKAWTDEIALLCAELVELV